MSAPRQDRRETRLLLATIVVSAGMLLLLARFRFPVRATGPVAEPAPAPLERLAATATYDELASIMADLERRILPSVTVVALEGSEGTVRYVPAPRLAGNRAVAVLEAAERLATPPSGTAPAIVARDAVRDLVVLDLPPAQGAEPVTAGTARPGPRYLAVVEATARGPAVRPVYVGRTDLYADPRWSNPVLTVAAVQQTLPPASAVFSLDGTFVGLVSENRGSVTIIPADTLTALAAGTPAAGSAKGRIDIEVEPLTPALARASQADKGVMISYVAPSLAGGRRIQSGDVIQSIDGIGVTTVAGFQQVTQSRTPGTGVTLALVRRGKPLTVSVPVGQSGAPAANAAALGATLQNVTGVGCEIVAIEPGSAAAAAGLRKGDLIVALDGQAAPDRAGIERALADPQREQAVLITIRRNLEHHVIALEAR